MMTARVVGSASSVMKNASRGEGSDDCADEWVVAGGVEETLGGVVDVEGSWDAG